jgi:hypothetical protein
VHPKSNPPRHSAFQSQPVLRALSYPLVLALIIIGWKKNTIRTNARICGLSPTFAFRIRFYQAAALDLLKFLKGDLGIPIQSRPQDLHKLQNLKSSASLFLTAHFHHWECMGAWMAAQGVPLLSGSRPMAHPLSNRLLAHLRKRMGMQVISQDLPRQALRHLRSGKCFGFLWDQRPSASDHTAPFFGIPVSVDALPPFLLRHTQAPVFFGVLLPNETFRILQLVHPSRPAIPTTNAPFPPSAPPLPLDPARLARRYHRVLEVLIRMHPHSWYGLAHRRFRDALPPTQASGVSRETSTPPGVMVSRETKVST